MKRIDTPTALAGGHFSNANPDAGGAPTQLDASWFENVQEELAAPIEFVGLTLNGGDKKQLLKAIQSIVARAGIAVPAGTAITVRGASVPEGYVQEDGRLLYIDKCPGLYGAIGNTYNGGIVPVGTFRVPNSSGRINVAAGSGAGLTDRFVGQTGGSETHTLTEDEMPAHRHGIFGQDGSNNTWNDGFSVGGNVGVAGEDAAGGGGTDPTTKSYHLQNADGTYLLSEAGGGDPHNNMPPFIVGISCIKLGPFDVPEVYPE